MNLKPLCLATLVSLLATPLFAEPSAEFTADAQALETKFQAKAKQNLRSEIAYAEELKGYDALIKKYQAEGPELAAEILYIKSTKYSGLLNNNAKAIELVQQIKRSYPATKLGAKADRIIATLTHADEAKKNQRALFVGAVFPDFAEKDLQGYVVNSAAYRGKVLFLDFGATTSPLWCAQTTNLLASYKKFHAQGFEVISVSLDESPAPFAQFAKAKGLPWKLICDGQEWAGKVVIKYGLPMLPCNLIVDRNGRIFARTVAASEFDAAIAAALAVRPGATTNVSAAKAVIKPAAPAPVKK